jgi:hypothetical protein
MTPTRAALAIPAAVLVLSGCGVAASHTARTTTVSVTLPKSAPQISASHLIRPLRQITPAPTYIVATVAISATNEWLEILNTSGAVVAKTEINPTLAWMIAAGAGGAYWTENGFEYELTPAGAIHKLGPVPSDASGVVVGPDGSSYAYATAAQLPKYATRNEITVVRPGVPAKVIADQVSDPNNPNVGWTWDYYLVSWTDPGIAFAEVPVGGCGCGSFDMQMQSAYSSIIDPVSEGVTTVTADTSCPLSDIGPAMESVCFAGTNGTTAIRIASDGTVVHTYSLSGKNLAGDALFSADASQLAYVTIPLADDQCGATINATLRVMNIASGNTVGRALGDFTPSAWSPGGLIYGSVTNATGTDTWLVAVNPSTLSVTRLTPNGADGGIVGIM